ncbi:hypothetical protein ACQKE4_17820, partial [Halomonas sp. NPDC076908]|uniref:hypothetical protein n=1 Tax=Halomonas sp. NPDC076908 TaxID=3390567 RepID=UPI003CFD2A09
LAKANLHGANDQKVLAGGDRESVGAGFTDSGLQKCAFGPINVSDTNSIRPFGRILWTAEVYTKCILVTLGEQNESKLNLMLVLANTMTHMS